MVYKSFCFVIIFIILCTGIIINVNALIGVNVRAPIVSEFPSIACITIYQPGVTTNENLLCTGTLITETLILTNGHCFQLSNVRMMEIVIKNSIYSPETIYYPIWWIDFPKWVTYNPDFNQDGYHDIAVIKLLGLLSHVVPAVLSTISPIDPVFGLNSKMVGCGRSRINNVSPTLKVGIVKLMSRQECSSHLSDLLGRRYSISIGLMCSRNTPYVVMEPGDSGGPLFFQGSLIGLNVGLYPRPNEANTENKVNAHIETNKYSIFIDLHKALE